MIKVLIVDDELLVRIGIKSTIRWEEYGFEVIGDAANGEDAINIFREKKPQIVITDIRMPKMDGIELTRRLKETNPNIRVIILTSYNEFEYARQALALGASDYIIKSTMEPEELIDTLVRIKYDVEADMKREEEVRNLKDENEKNRNIAKQKILIDILNGEVECKEPNIEKFLYSNGIKLLYENFFIICFTIDKYEENYKAIDLISRRLLKKSVINICDSIMPNIYNSITTEIKDGVYVNLLSINTSSSSHMDVAIRFANLIQNAISQYTRVSVSISVSREIKSANEIYSVFSNTLEALGYKVFLHDNCIITHKDIMDFEKEKNDSKFEEDEEFYHYTSAGDEKKINELLKETFAKVKVGKKSLLFLKYICSQLISLLNRLSREAGLVVNDEKEFFEVEEVLRLENVQAIQKWFEKQFMLLVRGINQNKYCCESSVIRKAVKFISENYMKDLRLSDVANNVNISRSYLSQMFKKETGYNYIDYLNNIRIRKAKELMRFGNYKTYEVAEMVGFQESGYFTKIFKRVEQMTPSEYLKKVNK